MNHPQLHSVAATGLDDVYQLVLHPASGEEIVWQATVGIRGDGPQVVGLDPGPNGPEPWGGDAESARSIVAAVIAVHRARHYGRGS